jgi:bifunctional DNA-binding transcriptional regulator/antitoxin component of YhaV-PrlF toxin-antitoxin module
MVKTRISSKGQTTIPAVFRQRWNTAEVMWESLPDGTAVVRPVPDIMSLFGSVRAPIPAHPNPKSVGREAWGKSAGKRKRAP